jgi:hypothetical protein
LKGQLQHGAQAHPDIGDEFDEFSKYNYHVVKWGESQDSRPTDLRT